MFSVFRSAGKALKGLALALAATALAGCDGVPMAGGGGGQTIDPRAPVQVALLLPSGQAGDAVLSRSLQNAARLAIADLQGVQIDLKTYDTGAGPAGAAAAGARAVRDGAKIILGPVYADAANAVGVAVAPNNVNVLAFSNNTAIAGGNVFILGNTFENTAERLVRYAARRGERDIVIVHEQTPAGELGRAAIQSVIGRSGARLAGVVGYPFSQAGVVAAVPRVAAAVQSTGADAVFLTADSAGALPLFAQMLPEAGVAPSTTQYIGLTRWDIPPSTASLPGVQGGWFALPDPQLTSRFRARYAAAYGGDPHPIAGLAYDGIAAIGALVRQRGARALTSGALTQGSGFAGVNGPFRLRRDGTNERALAVAEIRNRQVVVIDAAPRSFGGAGL